eukprot:353699-Chlamydomonas_euryale.AAC.1
MLTAALTPRRCRCPVIRLCGHAAAAAAAVGPWQLAVAAAGGPWQPAAATAGGPWQPAAAAARTAWGSPPAPRMARCPRFAIESPATATSRR